jgi:transposase
MSARARRMAELSAVGKSTRDIACLFCVSTRTVQRTLKNQKSKLSRHSEAAKRPEKLGGETGEISGILRPDKSELRMTG